MSESNAPLIRRVVHYGGDVQGVGFRYTTNTLAARFHVTGYVKNLGDGRVELVIEGAAAELDRLQEAIADRMAGYIGHTEVQEAPATGEFNGFRVAF
ncbi:MAG TPA: acylphosphatase [Phycisphaerae bacterium]|nr:acylphosphatase [Phycisphaerae bacterium]HNU45461.1 acylphosphatase [Phycisphaerae bacterium]